MFFEIYCCTFFVVVYKKIERGKKNSYISKWVDLESIRRKSSKNVP